jgi:hypothetical protein
LDDHDKKAASPNKPRAKARAGNAPQQGNLGNALRSVYQQTVSEDIPPEMLDLLGKLN